MTSGSRRCRSTFPKIRRRRGCLSRGLGPEGRRPVAMGGLPADREELAGRVEMGVRVAMEELAGRAMVARIFHRRMSGAGWIKAWSMR